MRVLFLGQTGINKSSCIESLARHCLVAFGLPGDLENIRAREHLRVFHLENYIGSLTADDYISYLDLFNTKRQQDIWAQAWDNLSAELSNDRPEIFSRRDHSPSTNGVKTHGYRILR